MKFILLVHHDETAFEKMSDETKKGLLTESIGLCHQLDAKGEYVHASPVHPAATAAIVRVREGKPIVTDGPFIEAKELMGGFAIFDVPTLEDAIAWGKRFRSIIGEGESELVRIYGPSDYAGG